MKLFLTTADFSGDIHARYLVEAIRKISKNMHFIGFGGQGMKNAKVEIRELLVSHGSIGLSSLIKPYKTIFRWMDLLTKFRKIITDRTIGGIILISSPILNLPLAKIASKIRPDIPCIYYIPPEIWAEEVRYFGRKEVRKIIDNVSTIISLFEFEKKIYENYVRAFSSKIEVIYEGHPFLDFVHPRLRKEEARRKYLLSPGVRSIGLLPGSREQEISMHLPIMLETAMDISQRYKNINFFLPILDIFKPLVDKYVNQPKYKILKENKLIQPVKLEDRYDVINLCDIIVAVSGSCTLEAACLGTPSIVVYKLARLETALISMGAIKFKTDYIALPNILMALNKKGPVYPELLQGEVNHKRITKEVIKILEDRDQILRIKKSLKEIREHRLGEPKVLNRIAKAIVAKMANNSYPRQSQNTS